jgi:tetratricopeptide (TPR) repeat protein
MTANSARLLQEALKHHQAGRLSDAESLYKRIIKTDPNNANALSLLGTVTFARNQLAEAEKLYRRAIAANPNAAGAHFNLGNVLSSLGDDADALAAYDKAIALDPAFIDARLNKGALLQKLARSDEAMVEFRRLVAAAPHDVRGHYNLGQSSRALGRFEEAELSYARVIALAPQHRDAYLALAEICERDRRIAEAISHTKAALAIQPTPEIYSNLGDLLRRADDYDAALQAHRLALKTKPDEPAFLFNYGAALFAAEFFDDAADAFRRVLTGDPDFLRAYHGLAKVHERQGRMDEAVAELERGLTRAPGNPDLVFQLALRQLTRGALREGWRNYEARFETSDKRQAKRATPPPYWAGESLAGKSILVWTEQGPGDEILYAGMIPDIAARAARCVVECSPRLVPVFARSFSGIEVRMHGSAVGAENFDYQIAIASLGQYLRGDFSSFPQRQSYLKAAPGRAAALRARYRARAPGQILVGISWRSKNEEIGAIKNTRLGQWRDILGVPGVSFINLQYGDCAAELADAERSSGVRVFDDAEIDPLRDMDDYFAQVAAMDLVISTSNTAVHVAGSLGIPTWLILPGRSGSLWYWFGGDLGVPWYPSLRVLSPCKGSERTASWESVLELAASGLRDFVARKR